MLNQDKVENIKFCIVGTGLAGTATLWHLVQKLSNTENNENLSNKRIEIITIEKQSTNGPGYPYSSSNTIKSHRCNNQASTMSVFDNDFVDWMLERKNYLCKEHLDLIVETHPGIEASGWIPNGNAFYPRALFGIYLSQRFSDACKMASQIGIKISSYNNLEVVDAVFENGKSDIKLVNIDNKATQVITDIDKILISTGHWLPEESDSQIYSDRFLKSPYPPEEIKEMMSLSKSEDEQTFFIQGMGPSAIDALLTAFDNGGFITDSDGQITSYSYNNAFSYANKPNIIIGSRSGFFSGVRTDLYEYDCQYLTEDNFQKMVAKNGGHLKLKDVISTLNTELISATNGQVSWDDLLEPKYSNAREKLVSDLSDSLLNRLVYTIVLKARRMRFYRYLNAKDKKVYDQDYDSIFMRIAVPMPRENAQKILALMDSGYLSTIKMGYKSIEIEPCSENKLLVHFEANKHDISPLKVDGVIKATGQNFSIKKHPSQLIKNLQKTGEISIYSESGYEPGGISVDPENSYRAVRYVNGQKELSNTIYSFGAPVQFWQNERNFSVAFVEAASSVAEDWLRSVCF